MVTPAASATSALRVWRDPSDSRACTRMAWLTGAGVYRGTLNFASDDASGVLENHGALPPPPPTEGDAPASLQATAHHVIVLYSTHLVAMNVVTGDVEATIELPRGGAGTFACTDPTTGRTTRRTPTIYSKSWPKTKTPRWRALRSRRFRRRRARV